MLRKFIMLPLLLSFSANAAWVAEQSQVIAVESTSGNSDVFTAIVKGGSGPCISTSQDTLIYFPRSEAANTEIHNRTYSMLLTALASKAKVSIYNFKDNTCNKAVGVRLISN